MVMGSGRHMHCPRRVRGMYSADLCIQDEGSLYQLVVGAVFGCVFLGSGSYVLYSGLHPLGSGQAWAPLWAAITHAHWLQALKLLMLQLMVVLFILVMSAMHLAGGLFLLVHGSWRYAVNFDVQRQRVTVMEGIFGRSRAHYELGQFKQVYGKVKNSYGSQVGIYLDGGPLHQVIVGDVDSRPKEYDLMVKTIARFTGLPVGPLVMRP
jgi:hypothetical protein